jgi:predicted double-glycine peptidase
VCGWLFRVYGVAREPATSFDVSDVRMMGRSALWMRRSHVTVGLGLAGVAIASVAARPATVERPASALIAGMPHVRQKPDFCGEACVAMVLRKLGVAADQDDVFAATGLDPRLGRGAFTRELADAVEKLGFRPSQVWYEVAPACAERELSALVDAMVADLARGVPSIVCTRFDESPRAPEHFRLVLGYDRDRDEIVFHDPALADGAYRRMARARFVRLWPLKY